MGNMSSSELRSIRRDDVECDLDFVGFLIISTPLRPESKGVVQELLQASHHVSWAIFGPYYTRVEFC